MDKNVAAAFTAAGVSHIVAISGWNIAIVAATVAALMRGRLTRRRRAIVTILAIVGYTLFAGASASVMRAAVMAGVAMAAVESGRGSRVMVGLAWAMALMILVEPATVADVGFQLSAAATAGLLLGLLVGLACGLFLCSPLGVGTMTLGFVYFVFLPAVATTPLAGRAAARSWIADSSLPHNGLESSGKVWRR